VKLDKNQRKRGSYLGGHDAARICGVFPYGAGPADTYAHIVHGQRAKPSPRMLRGMFMEDGLMAWIAEQRGVVHERDAFFVDDEVPFFAGSIDGIEDGGEVAHEATTTTTNSKHMWGVPGTDDCAKHKWVQSQWYMGLVHSIREFHVWCFVVDGDEMPLHYVVPRNEVAIAEMRERSEAFWYDHILARVPPLPGVGQVYDADANEALQACFPSATGAVLDAEKDAKLIELASIYAAHRASRKLAETEQEKAGAALKALLGEHAGARWSGGSVSWQSRSIGDKTNWEQVAHEIALKTGLAGEVFNGLVRENTFAAKSVRALRVSVKGIK
jgi:hypothetical protein